MERVAGRLSRPNPITKSSEVREVRYTAQGTNFGDCARGVLSERQNHCLRCQRADSIVVMAQISLVGQQTLNINAALALTPIAKQELQT
jgi:hypothetical protein